MKNKREYSLTAKERKARRRAKEKETGKPISKTPGRADQEESMRLSQARGKRSALILSSTVAFAVVLILIAMIVPVVLYLVNPYRNYNGVIARFNLSNGMTLEYVIDEDKYDTAATNFIFLAKNKYFNNTVFFDAQNGWLRFGGYEGQPSISVGNSSSHESTKHHSRNEKFCSDFSALPSKSFTSVTNKFGYKLRADNSGTNSALLNQIGVLTYLYSDTTTEFQFAYKEQASNEIRNISSSGGSTTQVLEPTMVGHALNEETIQNLIAISALAATQTKVSYGNAWLPPTPDIYIRTVKVYNLNSSKWKKFDFISYMNGTDSDGRTRLSGWTGLA